MKIKKVIAAPILACGLLLSALPGVSGSSTAFAADSGSAGTADTEHKPGDPGYGDMVPADLKVPFGSKAALPGAKPDAENKVPHICAGKKLLHHAHVDAGYVTRVNGVFTVTVVDGQQVVKDPSTVCVRLAPDARSSDGQEISRMIVPDTAGYSFLGAPKTILWHAPQQEIDGWRPVWAGLGAFDSHHEVKLPADVLLDEVKLRLSKVTGPGKVEVWRTVGFEPPRRGLSSDPALPPVKLNVGSHGHWSWTFSQAGVYQLGFEASYQNLAKQTIVSQPSAITWLVGTDDDVELPKGTTTGSNPIKFSAEDILAGKVPAPGGDTTTPGDTTGGTNGGTTGGTTPPPSSNGNQADYEKAIRDQIVGVTYSPKFIPNTVVSAGKYVLRGSYPAPGTSENNYLNMKLVDATVPGKEQDVNKDKAFAIEVPDTLRQKVTQEAGDLYKSSLNGNVWHLPEKNTDKNASLGFDFSAITKDQVSQPIVYSVFYKQMPKEARYLSGNMSNNILKIRLDTASETPRDILDEGAVLDESHLFTRPGLYMIEYDVTAKDAKGNSSYDSRTVYFVVGNDTINVMRKMAYEKAVALADDPNSVPQPQLLPGSVINTTPTPPSGTGDNGGTTTTPTTPVAPAKISLAEARTQLNASLPGVLGALITKGHMDQMLSYDGKDARVFVHDTAVPSKPLMHQSGNFAYAVPDSAWKVIPNNPEYAELKKAAPQGVWMLPEAQEDGLPWVGFSTLSVKYDGVGKEGVKVSLRNVRGPGRMITGHSGIGTFTKLLDTETPDATVTYAKPNHDHQAFYFTAPGTYTMDFVYTMQLVDGSKVEKVLTARFLVGDTSVTAGKEHLENAGAPTDPASTAQPGPAGRQPLPVNEVVSHLNKGEAIPVWRDTAPGSGVPAPQPATAAVPVSSAPADTTSAVTPSSRAETGSAGRAARRGAAASVGAASSGDAGQVANALMQTPTPADPNAAQADPNAIAGTENAVQALDAPDEHVSSLTNPANGSKALGSGGTPFWQWGLLGTGVLAMIGAGSYVFAIRK
ncbi:choice-of-anchor M domain-containing protein [Arcanobacterium bovis]|uniref:ABC transporter permease n=1 Tax=Arcanobacterium bovis TaxID=2529275 RepID=A0A4Q9V2J9_9ACTO|nr:choice-of-anchor M domain-containing protein [Arcanobacterium bovis]TBW23828.1 ABC transporter permease [Arcanobacterium bovis]